MTRGRAHLLTYAFFLAIITYLDRVCISAAAPLMMRDLDLSLVQMSVVFSAFTLAYAVFEVPSGWMGDVFGPRLVLTRIVVWWSVFTMLTGAAWNYVSLLAIRFLFGAGEAGAFPNISRAFSRWFPAGERGHANGILFLGSRMGGALAPALSLLVIGAWGWRASFVVFGLLGFVWAAAWYWWFRDEPPDRADVNVGPYASKASDAGADANKTSDVGADVHVGPAKVPWGVMLRSRNLYAVCGMYFAFGYGLYFYFTWLPTYLIRELGFSALAGGLFAGLPFVFAGAANVAGGWLTDRLAVRHGLRVGRCWLGAACFLTGAGLLLASTAAGDRVLRAVLLALALAAADLAISACWSVCLDIGQRHAGVVTGFMNTAGNLGGVAAPLVVGFVVAEYGSWNLPFYISAAVYVLGAGLWLAIDPDRPLDLPAPEGSHISFATAP